MNFIESATESDIQKWSKFLAEAGSACSYESNAHEKKVKLLGAKFRIIGPYRKNGLSYTDTYVGHEWFNGIEMIEDKGLVAWVRFYEGGITKPDFIRKDFTGEYIPKIIYEQLKSFLKKFPRDQPFRRGPSRMELNAYHYEDFSEGDFRYFYGRDRICLPIERASEEIYGLTYSGGTIDNPHIKTRLLASPIYQMIPLIRSSQLRKNLEAA
ncbi:MAG: DUF5680 domain-containing protein [Nanoarchaeota archaeon]